MSTNATSPESNNNTNVTASAPLVKSIGEILNVQLKLNDKFASTAAIVAKDAKERGIDRKLAGLMLANGYQVSFERGFEKATDKHEGETQPQYVTRMLAKTGPDRSKILTLAYPKDADAASELEKARKMGIGLNAQMEIARGKTTVEEIIAERQEKSASKGARPQDGSTKPANTTSTVKATDQANAAKGMTPKERMLNYCAAFYAYGVECGYDAEGMVEVLNEYLADREASEEKAS